MASTPMMTRMKNVMATGCGSPNFANGMAASLLQPAHGRVLHAVRPEDVRPDEHPGRDDDDRPQQDPQAEPVGEDASRQRLVEGDQQDERKVDRQRGRGEGEPGAKPPEDQRVQLMLVNGAQPRLISR